MKDVARRAVHAQRAAAGLLLRDWLQARSYQLPFMLGWFNAALSLALFFFLDRAVGDAGASHEDLAQGYFAFVAIGVAVIGVFEAGITSFATRLRLEQTAGTLESLMAAPMGMPVLVLGLAAFTLIAEIATAAFTLLLATLVFGMDLHADAGDAVFAAAAFACLLLIFAAVGIAVAAFTVVFKQAVVVMAPVVQVLGLISGAYFPLSVLPDGLRQAAEALPLALGLDALRGALLRGESDLSALPPLLAGAAVSLPLALWLFSAGTRKARRDGSLAQY